MWLRVLQERGHRYGDQAVLRAGEEFAPDVLALAALRACRSVTPRVGNRSKPVRIGFSNRQIGDQRDRKNGVNHCGSVHDNQETASGGTRAKSEPRLYRFPLLGTRSESRIFGDFQPPQVLVSEWFPDILGNRS